MLKEVIFGLVGGLGLFIYGIHLMGEGLQNAAGDRMRHLLKVLTKNRIMGAGVGAFITALMQSSSATTVMLVGFVNAGLMGLRQAIVVILGAHIGTTITGQIIAFKLTDYALPFIALGAVFYLFVNKRFWKFLGLFFLGFGILFLGLNIMTSGIKPLASDPVVREIFIAFSKNPVLGILTGAVLTAIFQSSSVTTGIIIGLGVMGLLDLYAAVPLIFGCNIGTCVTAMLASIGTTIAARRTAFAHILIQIMGAIIFLPTLFLFKGIFIRMVGHTSNDIARQIANAHTIFNIANTLLFLPFVDLFARLVTKMIPGEDVIIDTQPKFLEKHLLHTPTVAVDASIKEMVRMTELSCSMFDDAMKGFLSGDIKPLKLVSRKERVVDNLQEAITNYLMELMQKEISPEIANKIPSLLHSVNDIERIGDHSENLTELSERKITLGLPFSPEAEDDLKEMFSLVEKMGEITVTSLNAYDLAQAKAVLELEGQVNKLTLQLRENHINRLSQGKCKVLSGIIFLDMVSNFEKIGDHLTNVAQAVLGKLQWDKAIISGKPQKEDAFKI
ncbi:MAG: Na/Pi cotransporter family protein [Candidatus Omnitrophica bacterium]|nr:Na/Pi cotransporter family protein [Candidatus Omnitrophota bacterium]